MKPKNQSNLAEQLGISRQLLSAHMKKPDAPKLDDVAGWVEYLAQRGRVGSAPEDLRRAIAQKRLEILMETKEKMARANAVESGLMMPVADARRQNGEAWSFAIGYWEQHLGEEAPPEHAGRNAVELGVRYKKLVEDFRIEGKRKFEEAV